MRRKYSDKEKADALAVLRSNGDNILKTSHETGIPITTLWNWAREKHGINADIPKLETESKEELSSIFERVARKYLAHSETELAVTSTYGNVAVMAAATATDKMQLLRGQPTEITANGDRVTFLQTELRRLRSVHADNYDAYDASVRQLRSLFTDTTDPAYDPLLDYTKHPENWPQDLTVATKEVDGVQ